MFNATYVLTDYTRAGGSLCYVPGSHRLRRQPLPSEDFSYGGTSFTRAFGRVDAGEQVICDDPPGVVAVEAPRGSLVVWHGHTWHGAFARTSPGLRVNLILVFAAPCFDPQEPYRQRLSEDQIAGLQPRLRQLIGCSPGS